MIRLRTSPQRLAVKVERNITMISKFKSHLSNTASFRILTRAVCACLFILLAGSGFAASDLPEPTHSRFANVNGVRLHYLIADQGDPVVLLHGYAETSHMWLPLIAELAKTHTVIAPDLRGAGQSSTRLTVTPRP